MMVKMNPRCGSHHLRFGEPAAHPVEDCFDQGKLRSLTNGLPSRTNVCTRRKRTCGPQGGSPGLFRVSDDGPSRWCGLQRGRRPKAGKERTRGGCAREGQRGQLWGFYDAKGGWREWGGGL